MTVYNRTRASASELETLGARIAATPAEAVKDAHIVISCVTDGAVLRRLSEGEEGFAKNMAAGSVHVSMGTLTPEDARALWAVHENCGTRYLNVPVQGRPDMVANGELVAWAAGSRELYDQIAPLLSHLAVRRYWLGEDPGLSAVAKLSLNYLMYANIALFAETMCIVERSGLPKAAFVDGLLETVFDAPLFRMIAHAFDSTDHLAGGSDVSLTVKDLSQLWQHVAGLELHLPMLATVQEQYGATRDSGFGDLSQAAVIRMVTTPRHDAG